MVLYIASTKHNTQAAVQPANSQAMQALQLNTNT